MSIFEQQKNFMRACGQDVSGIPNFQQAELYLKLVAEELKEFRDAESPKDQLDAVIDVMVTLIGFGISSGYPMQAAWDEVHHSNMAKVGPDGKVKRREDGKILKPEGWKGPDLEKVLIDHWEQVLESEE